MKQKVLVLGASGMVGHVVSLYLKEKGYQVVGCGRKQAAYIESVCLDILNFEQLKDIVLKNRFDVVINCAGILNTACEKNIGSAILINSYLPHFLDKLSKESKHIKIIHMSTDCVFSGHGGPYFEDSTADGTSIYDRTKALGEIQGTDHITFRNSVIGPDINLDGIGLFHWFMKQHGIIYGYQEVLWTGVSSITLARAMETAIDQNVTGLYHLVNNTSISKFDLLNEFNTVFANGVEIKEDKKICSRKVLKNTREDFPFTVPSYHEMVLEIRDWINSHRYLYPHYLPYGG